jgi:hypothetical protein
MELMLQATLTGEKSLTYPKDSFIVKPSKLLREMNYVAE